MAAPAPSKKDRRAARRQAEADARRRRTRRKWVVVAVAGTLGLALIGGVIALAVSSSPSTGQQKKIDNGLVSDQRTAAGTGIRAVFTQPHLSEGKPLTFFLGGQFCPFCAATRWPLVKALSRFGTFSGLGQMRSRPGEDGFASIVTYDFAHASYLSSFLTLRTVEAADASGNALQRPDGEESPLINEFDPQGSIPFLFVGGRYVASLTYSPGLLSGRSFGQILDEANTPSPGTLGKAINSYADAITAAICSTDGARPADVCSSPTVAPLMKTLGRRDRPRA